ncbi:MAG TPA: type II toxin-antitoxin system VapC family toxin [Thermomicrobiales bacterium]|nr:type II toxin-antitoxin system VapC family toxin [Thermomicrobiales bacterium]
MTVLFLDSSALVKRYVTEIGTAWIGGAIDPAAGNRILVAEITKVEVAAALAARHRAPGGMSREARDNAVALCRRHFTTEYEVTPISRAILDRAVDLTQRHRLRGYDAVQLATALVAGDALLAAGQPGLTFVAADGDLVAAARLEGLDADDPNLHR